MGKYFFCFYFLANKRVRAMCQSFQHISTNPQRPRRDLNPRKKPALGERCSILLSYWDIPIFGLKSKFSRLVELIVSSPLFANISPFFAFILAGNQQNTPQTGNVIELFCDNILESIPTRNILVLLYADYHKIDNLYELRLLL